MKSLFTIFSLVWLTVLANAQEVKISGAVVDNKQLPLPGATVILLRLPDSVQIAAQAVDMNGLYHFAKPANGLYFIKAMMISFTTTYSAVIDVAGKDLTLPPIILTDRKTSLKEVSITSTLPGLQQKSDRLVVNLDKLNTTGENALDILKKAPGVSLDKDEQILYRNNGGVSIMIDGRLTYMSETELTAYLKSLPGNMISKIELIANPPGNYDAEGTAGIINIILKHNRANGYNGSANITGSYGKYGKIFGGIILNYNTGKFSFFSRVSTGYYDSYNKLTLVRQILDQRYNQLNYWHPKTTSTTYTIGADYHLAHRQTFGFMFKGYDNSVYADITSHSITLDNSGYEIGSVTGLNPQKTYNGTYSLNLNYTIEIDTVGQKLSIDADYVNNNLTENDYYTNTYFDPVGAALGNPVQLRSNSPVGYNIYSLKADYILPLGDHWQAEAGIKSSLVSTSSHIQFDSLKTEGWTTDPKRSNDFTYTENINAAYLTLNKTFGVKWDLKASIRGEQTKSAANSMDGNQIVNRDYLQLFPSVFITYKLDQDNQINGSVSRRISRPNYANLNSAIRYTDPYTAIRGNPYLQPSLSQSYLLNYTYKTFQILSLSYLKVDNAMNNVITQNDQTKESISTYDNLGQTTTISATTGGNFNVAKWWNVNAELDGQYDKVKTMLAGKPFLQSRFSWSGNIDQAFYLPQNYKVTLSAQYFSPSISGLARMLSGSQIDAGMSKTMLGKRLSLSFKARDIFFGSHYRSILQYNNVNTIWINEYESRRFSLGISYQFGNAKLKAARNRQTGSTAEEQRM